MTMTKITEACLIEYRDDVRMDGITGMPISLINRINHLERMERLVRKAAKEECFWSNTDFGSCNSTLSGFKSTGLCFACQARAAIKNGEKR